MDIKQVASKIKSQLLTKNNLLLKAAAIKKVVLSLDHNSLLISKPFVSYKLEGEFLDILKKNGFKLDYRTDGVITLSEENSEGYWNFYDKPNEKSELRLDLCVVFGVYESERGVVLRSDTSGGYLSPAILRSHLKVFEAVAQYKVTKIHPLVKEIVAGQGKTVVSWKQLGLGGLRSVPALFDELTIQSGRRTSSLKDLARSSVSPFDPSPVDQEERLFLPETYQPLLFELWWEQLRDFKGDLLCP